MKSEFDLIEKIKKKIPRSLQGSIGIGDDAGGFGDLLLASDTIADGVDFLNKKIRPELAGRKALAVNLSDIAAMGGKPTAFVINLGIPEDFSEKWIFKFYEGMMALAKKYKVSCLGGDISSAEQFFASVAILGQKGKRNILRSGAKSGDWIGVTGKLGGSILGHHADFEPRVREGYFLASAGVSSMLDISDGFLQDLGHILEASGKGAVLALESIPISNAAWRLSGKNCRKALEHALSDGEDFELLFTASDRVQKTLSQSWKVKFPRHPLYWVGKINDLQNKVSWTFGGKSVAAPKLTKKGYCHF